MLCAGRTVKELEVTARAITRKGGKAQVVPLDITDEAAVREQVASIIARHRRIDVLVNNAGIIYREAIVDTSTDTFRSAIETDLVSPVHAGARGRPPHAGAQVRPHRQHLLDHGRSSAAPRWRAMSRPSTA